MTEKSASLWFKEGSSDKVYQCTIEKSDGGYVVNFQYGRRGAALTSGSKTTSPVPLEKAESIFDKLVREKTSKGYRHVGEAAAIPTVENSDEEPLLKCNLLNPVSLSEAIELLESEDWFAQEKMDGVRFILYKEGNTVLGFNRRGKRVPVPEGIKADALTLKGDFALDGELIGEVLHVFDMPFNKRLKVTERMPADDRVFIMETACLLNKNRDDDIIVSDIGGRLKHIRPVRRCHGAGLKFSEQLQREGAEGIVLKLKSAGYIQGRPASGGNYLKYKFCETATCIVMGINSQRSVSLGLKRESSADGSLNCDMVECGNCTIPANHKVPAKGSVVEVRYLYANHPGILYQPVYLGVREDMEAEDVNSVTSLKFKTHDLIRVM